jgi:hypothetical protein
MLGSSFDSLSQQRKNIKALKHCQEKNASPRNNFLGDDKMYEGAY